MMDNIHISTINPKPQYIEFDIHGIVGIRLVNPSHGDSAKLMRRFGSYHNKLDRAPEITIRFVDQLAADDLVFLGKNYAGFTDDGFFVIDEFDGGVIARVPFEKVGSRIEMLCKSGSSSVPLLFDIIRFTLMAKGYISLHASAFLVNDTGVVVTGWTKGGKSESLLSFANNGAEYVGDEWVVISKDGKKMFGLPINIAIWDWQFKQIPELLPKISLQKRVIFKLIHIIDSLFNIANQSKFSDLFSLHLIGRAIPILQRGLKIRESPESIFQERISKVPVKPEKLFLAMSHNNSEYRVDVASPEEIASQMVNSNEFEQTNFFEYYQAFKFAFPYVKNEFLENVRETQNELLHQALGKMEAYKVFHPYPLCFEDLYQQMRPYCEDVSQEKHNFYNPVKVTLKGTWGTS